MAWRHHEDFSCNYDLWGGGVDDRLPVHWTISESQSTESEKSWCGNWRARRARPIFPRCKSIPVCLGIKFMVLLI